MILLFVDKEKIDFEQSYCMFYTKMASFRRILSLAQRDEIVQSDQTFSISSSPPKLFHTQKHLHQGSSLTASFCSSDLFSLLHRIWMIAFCTFSKRSFRSAENLSKSKGCGWKKPFFYFLLSFMLGAIIGLVPLLSMDLWANFMQKHLASSLEVSPPNGNEKNHFNSLRYTVLPTGNESENNASMDVIQDLRDEILDTFSMPSIYDSDIMYRKLLIIVTSTDPRPFQEYYLNQLANTLKLVPPPLLWIVVEMAFQSLETAELLRKTGVMYRHLVCETNMTGLKDKAVHQRNLALSHIQKHHLHGIVYFTDDNNLYTTDLFMHMREIKRFGTWPVAKLMDDQNKVILEGPVCNGSQVIGWHTNERSMGTRRFHVERSGFAFNSSIIWDPRSFHRPTLELIRQQDTTKEGFSDSAFMEMLVEDESQMEAIPEDCSKIMVWNLRLEPPHLYHPKSLSLLNIK